MRKRELERRLADAKAQERETKTRLNGMRERVADCREEVGMLAADRAELANALVSIDRQAGSVLEAHRAEHSERLRHELLELERVRELLYAGHDTVSRVLVDHDAVRRMSP